MLLGRVTLLLNLELNALGGITAILKYSIPELNDIEDETNYEQITEEDDDDMNMEQLKKLDLDNNDEGTGFSDEEAKKEEHKQVQKKEKEEEKKEETKQVEEDEWDEYLGLGAGKKDKNFSNKSKRKSSKLEKKEREVQRMVNSRKKSEFDDNF